MSRRAPETVSSLERVERVIVANEGINAEMQAQLAIAALDWKDAAALTWAAAMLALLADELEGA